MLVLVSRAALFSPVDAAVGGGLGGAADAAPSTVDLSSEGVTDWAHWGLSSGSSFNRKAGVTAHISNIKLLGAAPQRFSGNPSFWTTHVWSDGEPTASQAGFPGGIYFQGVGSGYEISVSADTSVRTLRLYAGGFTSRSQVQVTLSDGSAPVFVTVLDNPSGVVDQVVTLTFSAASAGQTLTVRHTLEDDYGGVGNMALQAATMQQVSGANQLPTFNPPIGDQHVTEGNTLVFPLTASDPDGSAPLVLSISSSTPPLTPAVNFVDNGDGTGSFSWTPGSADVNVYSVTFAATEGGGAGLTIEQTIILTVDAAGGGTTLLADNFNDGDTAGWSIVDNCPSGSPEWSVQASVLMQTNNCFGFSSDGIAPGTFQLSGLTLPGDIDIQVQLRSEDPLLDPVTSNDASKLKYGTIGMIFGYQDTNNYYRFELNARNGHRKLWRVQGGTFTELVTSPQSYVGRQWMNLRIIHQNGVILIFLDGTQVMAADDVTYSSGKIAFFCAVNPSCSFDNLVVLAAPNDPMPGLNLPDSSSPAHASGEYFVTPGSILDVAGMTSVATGIGGMEFVLDEGSGGEISLTDFVPPYSSRFSALVPGEHTVTGYLLDTSRVRISSGTATASMPHIGTGGIHLYAMGDSVTYGLLDDIAADDISADTRNTGGGYEPVLNDYLSAYNGGVPVTVMNDGNSGELTSTGAGRIGVVLARTPEVEAYLVGYGTNNSGGSMPLLSGFGLDPADSGYAGSYKDYLQQIIDAVVLPPPMGAGKLVFFAKIPPLKDSRRNARVQEFNLVIDELIAQLKIDYPSRYLTYTPPDFHSYFTANQAEFSSDLIHPNGTGYQSMGRLWCEALNGLQGWFCLDDDKDGLLNSLEAQLGTDPLLADTDGDGLVDGNDGFVPIGNIPAGVDTNGDGFADGEQVFATDPLLADSDGDRLDDGLEAANSADPLDANSWPALADGDIAPLGAPDGEINAGDILVATRIALGLETATALELAHGDLYPPGAPDGKINLQDLILLRKMP